MFEGVKVIIERQTETSQLRPFSFQDVPAPSDRDTATHASFRLLEGEPDDNSGPLETLHDGKTPALPDEPEANFFFAAGTQGGQILLDLGHPTPIAYIATYSRHPNTRGPQIYTLYGAAADDPGFTLPKGINPTNWPGWTRIADVDTRGASHQEGGLYGVLVTNIGKSLGRFRYLLFDIRPTQARHMFANTFYSEIDVQSADPSFQANPSGARGPAPFNVQTRDGRFAFTIDLQQAPELEPWVRERLIPVILEWYPNLAQILRVEGVTPPEHVHITLRPGRGVAATSGARITANSRWIQRERDREAVGAIVHELVHVVQQYGRRPPGSPPPPGWLVEGIADYVRWFRYEPERHGADLVWLRRQRGVQLRHDAGYRISANFLDWVSRRHDPELIQHLNAALRLGRYEEAIWKERTGKTLEELAEAWRVEIQQAFEAP